MTTKFAKSKKVKKFSFVFLHHIRPIQVLQATKFFDDMISRQLTLYKYLYLIYYMFCQVLHTVLLIADSYANEIKGNYGLFYHNLYTILTNAMARLYLRCYLIG